ncbi:NUDIX hydrolase [Deinococcus budaensis]|uniref:8-oxo-dGTP pyrophosphatase MutT (NUDIX family) n=1 Tax=Deinococcus budaensis TaxID=1665626 RepID=A0A7W8GCG9_9DEIO|nr:NUDIX hydrolase [Deinococcus budaensis]MBB5233034.1 8-oxo-dGTP pyrophosphatase MutT (NUDIX family) [Deinococcus budaensis]
MADYERWPLWMSLENVDPLTLMLAPELTARLLSWAEAFDSSLDMENAPAPLPMQAAFLRDGEDERHSFEREGHTLWRLLQAARPDLHVTYHSTLLGRELNPDEDELLDLLDDAGKVRGVLWRSASEGVRHKRGVTAFLRNSRGEVFFPRRAAHKTRWPGALDFSVGGLVLAGETFEEGFRRETREELNLDPPDHPGRLLGEFSPWGTGLRCFTRVYEIRSDATPAFNPLDFSEGVWLAPGRVFALADAGEAVNGDLLEVLRLTYGKSQ